MLQRTILIVVLLSLLAACSGQPTAVQPTTTPAPIPTTAPTTETSAFPVTITHKYGSTTILSKPQRVIALGYTDQDPILALGVQPVAVRYFFGDPQQPYWPWAAGRQSGTAPTVLNMPFGELNIEAIAALKPDLIVAVSAGITAEEYATLSRIAPTLAQSNAYVNFGVPWQEQTKVIGQALGRAAEAEALVAATEARFAELRRQHPEFVGATAAIAAPAPDGQFFFSGPQHERQRVLTSLGFVLPDELVTIAGDSFYGTISGERLDLLDTDVLLWIATPDQRSQIEASLLYQQLRAVKEGRVIWLDTSSESDLIGPALIYSSVLSLPIVFEELVPRLVAALDGDPATNVGSAAGQTTAETITITDARGTTVTIPRNPQRIVALSELDLDSALALGIAPVGAVNGRGQAGLPQYLGANINTIVSVGTLAEPSLEAIVALQPDLILAGTMIPQIEALLPQLSAIAPVVATYNASDDWKTAFTSIARILNRTAEAEAFLANYNQRVAEVKALVPAESTEANIVRWMPQGPVVMMPTTFASRVLADIGFSRPAAIGQLAGSHGAHSDPLSLEQLELLDSGWWFIGTLNPDGATALKTARENPLFQQLDVVKEGRVVEVDGSVWTSIGGPLAALRVLNDVEEALK